MINGLMNHSTRRLTLSALILFAVGVVSACAFQRASEPAVTGSDESATARASSDNNTRPPDGVVNNSPLLVFNKVSVMEQGKNTLLVSGLKTDQILIDGDAIERIRQFVKQAPVNKNLWITGLYARTGEDASDRRNRQTAQRTAYQRAIEIRSMALGLGVKPEAVRVRFLSKANDHGVSLEWKP